METSATTIIIFVASFALVLLVLLRVFSSKTDGRKRGLMQRAGGGDFDYSDEDTLLSNGNDDEGMASWPVIGPLGRSLKQAGMGISAVGYLLVTLIILMVVTYFLGSVFANFGLGFGLAAVFTYILMTGYLKYRIEKRNQMFLDNFPDALDMIVRSVKSGHPLLSSLRMITENSEDHVAQEFQQVVDEVSYGAPLSEALHRMAERINLLDINFFVVILSVQQDTGGNLSEVLSNLSGIIRKRRQLRLKINAMTSEGRFTSWIFAAIPIVQLIVVKFIAPEYINVLFETGPGRIMLAVAAGFIMFSIYISKRMCKINI